MTTPLQKAAQAVIDRWDSPAWKDQAHTAEYIAELRKALDAEIVQAVEPVAFMRPSIEGYDSSYRDANVVVMSKASGATHWDESGWVPLYLHPPQPQATTAVPEGYVLVPIEPTEEALANGVRAMRLFVTKNSLIDFSLGYKAMLAAAKGEKP